VYVFLFDDILLITKPKKIQRKVMLPTVINPNIRNIVFLIYLTNVHGYVLFVVMTIFSFMSFHLVCNKSNTSENTSSPSGFSGVPVDQSCLLLMFCRSLFVPFSLAHCIVCSSSICGFWLPILYLQTFLISLFADMFIKESPSSMKCEHIVSGYRSMRCSEKHNCIYPVYVPY
jgi:phosphatidylserine synthase